MRKTFLYLMVVVISAKGGCQAIDTFRTYNFGKMPIAYSEEKIYWEKNYNEKGQLMFEGLRYTDCFIGTFINYYEDGKKKTEGQYMGNTTGNWNDLQLRGLCSIQVGEWKAYNEAGMLTNRYYYDSGKLVKEEAVIDTAITMNYGKMPPVYFSNKVYWEKNFDKDNHLVYEGLKYNSCFIGNYFAYYDNGKLKTKGQYLSNVSGDWTDLKKRGLCSIMDGEWKNYGESGDLKNTILYKDGKILKEN